MPEHGVNPLYKDNLYTMFQLHHQKSPQRLPCCTVTLRTGSFHSPPPLCLSAHLPSCLRIPTSKYTPLRPPQALASSLVFLDVRDNRIAGPVEEHAPHLAALARLNTLLLMSPGGGQTNPVCAFPGYRAAVFAAAFSLDTLDGVARNAPNPPVPRNTDTNWSGVKIAGGRLVGREVEGQSHEGGGSCGEQQRRGSSRRRAAPRTPDHNGFSLAPQSSHSLGIPGGLERTGHRAGSGESEEGEHSTGKWSGLSGKGEGGRAGLPPPEEVVPAMPRFDEVAGRFLQRRRREEYPDGRVRPGRLTEEPKQCKDFNGHCDYSGGSGGVDGCGSDGSDSSVTMSVAAEIFVGGRRHGDSNRQHGTRGVTTDETRAAESGGSGGCGAGTICPEDTTRATASSSESHAACGEQGLSNSRDDRKMTERDRSSKARSNGNGGQGNEDEEALFSPGTDAGRGDEHGVEEEGLLSRLRSVAQEARLEVMENRLQKLHVSILSHKMGGLDAVVVLSLAYAKNMPLSSTWFDDKGWYVLFELLLRQVAQVSPALACPRNCCPS